jgi:APA family basic amino acid/polyamine antiporter
MRAQAILMPLPRRGGTPLFPKTVETVLAERPCRVVLLSEPAKPAAKAADAGRAVPVSGSRS